MPDEPTTTVEEEVGEGEGEVHGVEEGEQTDEGRELEHDMDTNEDGENSAQGVYHAHRLSWHPVICFVLLYVSV